MAEHTGTATASGGGVAITGVVDTVNVGLFAPVRSRYLEQVRLIAPPRLLGRDAELAELTGFCTVPDPAPAYLWWRGPAWAGKSALMAWFVLHPPAGVKVVSFFTTARFAAHNDRNAFIDLVLEQLAELLKQPMPTLLTDANRAGHLLGMLADAAAACKSRDERLVLLVDGLDEDRGVTIGGDTYSIAGLLPEAPPLGLRIVVAGRPNPPIPSDVSDRHPLRDREFARSLDVSPYADAVREDAQQELRRLHRDEPVGRDLLGLLVAAGGGLSAADLAALTGASPAAVDARFTAVSGRTFEIRRARWHPDTQVYVLGHEELHRQAAELLGAAALDGYRQRLHDWAARYRSAGWPDHTPEYLLNGYFALLSSMNDVPRMVACVLDTARLDQMLVTTGSDSTVRTEINIILEHLLGQAEPDLATMALLAFLRDHLDDRNATIADELCALWAVLGEPDRAEMLAATANMSVGQPFAGWHQAVTIAIEVAEAGDHDRALALAEIIREPMPRSRVQRAAATALARAGDWGRARTLTGDIGDPYQRTQALRSMARVALDTGDLRRARAWAKAAAAAATQVTDPGWQGQARCDVAATLARCGEIDRAMVLARSIGDLGQQLGILGSIIEAVADSGDPERAAEMANSITDPAGSARGLADAARGARRAGLPHRYGLLMDQSLRRVRLVADAETRSSTTRHVVTVIAEAGDYTRAESLARTIEMPMWRNIALCDIAEIAADAGQYDRAVTLARATDNADNVLRDISCVMARRGEAIQAEELIRSLSTDRQAPALRDLSQAFAAGGAFDKALILAAFIGERDLRNEAVRDIATQMALHGEQGLLMTLVDEVGTIRSSDPDWVRTLVRIAVAVALAGDHNRAAALAQRARTAMRQGTSRQCYEVALEKVSQVARWEQSHPPLNTSTARLDAMIRPIAMPPNEWRRSLAQLALGPDRPASGDAARSRDEMIDNLICAIVDRDRELRMPIRISWGDKTLRLLATTAALAGDHHRAETLVELIADRAEHDQANRAIAIAAARAGHHDHADTVADSIANPHWRARTLADLALSALVLGDPVRAAATVEAIDDAQIRNHAMADLSIADALLGDHQAATTTVNAITDPDVRTDALADLAVATAVRGDYPHATSIAQAIVVESVQHQALKNLALAMAVAGECDRAEQLLRSSPDPLAHVSTQAEIAQWAPAATARRLLAEVFYHGRATTALTTMARVQPEAMAALSAKLRDLAAPGGGRANTGDPGREQRKGPR